MGAEIFQGFLQQPKSVMDYQNEMADAQARRQNNALRAMAMQQQVDQRTQGMARQNALQQIAGSLGPQATAAQRAAALRANPLLWGDADAVEKADLERRNTESQIGERNTKAEKEKYTLSADKFSAGVRQVLSLGGPQEAAQGITTLIQRGDVDPQMGQAILKSIPSDPTQFDGWKLRYVAGLADPKAMVEMLKPHLQTVNLGGQQVQQAVDPITGKPTTTGTMQNTQSPDNAATNATSRANNAAQVGATIRGQTLTDARARDLNAITREGQQTQVINDPVRGPLLVNKGTGLVRPGLGMDGQPVPGETVVKRQQAANNTLPVIDEARKLLDQSTGSFVGRGVDYAARGVGMSTPGDAANAKLKVLQANLMLAQPRMEGPQSDKDVQLYREAAGQIGDATVPAEIKKAALDTIEAMQRKYATRGGAGAAPAAAAPPAAGGFRIVGVK